MVEQKEIIYQLYQRGSMTTETSLRFLNWVYSVLSDRHSARVVKKTSTGEQRLYGLLRSPDAMTAKMLAQEVDLDKLRGLLAEYNIPFAIEPAKEGGNHLFFRVKDEALMKQAFEKFFDEVTKRPDQFAKRVVKTAGKMNFYEKMAYYKLNFKYKGTMANSTKTTTSSMKMKGTS